ncbi:hypothetical protein SRABI70_00379 [Pseudomonas sp. Bi70]|nr:hypothetical protein SRABI70_00379 [Pseudomonas sp. Bi70]
MKLALRPLHAQLLLVQFINHLPLTQQCLITLHRQFLYLLLQRGNLGTALPHHPRHAFKRSAKWRVVLQGALDRGCMVPRTQIGKLPTQLISEFTFTSTEKHDDYPASPCGRRRS